MADEQVIETTETPAETTEKVETPVEGNDQEDEGTASDEQSDSEGEEGTEEKPKDDIKKPEKQSRLDRRFKELTSRIRNKETDVQYWREALSEVTGEAPPDRKDYGSAEDYLSAVEDYRDKIRTPKVMLERAEKDVSNLHRETQGLVAQNWEEAIQNVSKVLPDYQKVMAQASDVPMHPEVTKAIMRNKVNGPFIAYHLATNTDVAYDLADMPLAEQLLELGRLESRINAGRKIVPQKTNKPILPPIEAPRVQGKTPTPRKDPSKFSLEEHIAWRANGGGKK